MRPVNLVVIIDDDKFNNFITKMEIEETHLVNQIKVFSNGKDAIDFFKAIAKNSELLPEIILLDLNMPVMNGFEFLDEYVKLEQDPNKKIHIYIVSTCISPADLKKISQISEVSDYIFKPITKEKFEKIANALNKNKIFI